MGSLSTEAEEKQKPWLFVGLSNPGKLYRGTRYNVGFELLDFIAEAEGISMSTVSFKFGRGFTGDVPVMLAKPQTFMNDSGESVGSIVSYYKIPLKQVLVTGSSSTAGSHRVSPPSYGCASSISSRTKSATKSPTTSASSTTSPS